MSNQFERDNIRALSDREKAREKLPVFYGSRDGLYQGFMEVLNNGVDEVLNNFDKGTVEVILHDDNQTITSKVRTNSKNAWAATIEYVLKDVDTSWYETPKNVVAIPLNAITGNVTNDTSKAALYYYVRGSEPGGTNEQYVSSEEEKNTE